MSIPSVAQAWLIPENATGYEDLQLKEFPVQRPEKGEVLVRIRAVSLNYRDLMVVSGNYRTATKAAGGLIPISDAAGDIVEIGEGVTEFKVGDRVHTLFHQNWLSGPSRPLPSSALGGDVQGCLTQYKIFDAIRVLPIPSNLSYEEASTIPCAGVTAFAALFTNPEPPGPTSDVLVQGTGGVSLWTLQLAKTSGARVIATSSSNEKIARLKQIGADFTINYKDTPNWSTEVKKLTGGVGVDHVVEIGGPGTLFQSLKSLRQRGHIHVIGASFTENIENGREVLGSIMLGQAQIHGIAVGSRDMAAELDKIIVRHNIKPIVDKVFKFEEAKEAWKYLESQQHFGKIVIRL